MWEEKEEWCGHVLFSSMLNLIQFRMHAMNWFKIIASEIQKSHWKVWLQLTQLGSLESLGDSELKPILVDKSVAIHTFYNLFYVIIKHTNEEYCSQPQYLSTAGILVF